MLSLSYLGETTLQLPTFLTLGISLYYILWTRTQEHPRNTRDALEVWTTSNPPTTFRVSHLAQCHRPNPQNTETGIPMSRFARIQYCLVVFPRRVTLSCANQSTKTSQVNIFKSQFTMWNPTDPHLTLNSFHVILISVYKTSKLSHFSYLR